MNERQILFSGPMVRAIIAGQKTVTRRIISSESVGAYVLVRGRMYDPHFESHVAAMLERCPYGAAGDRLWVREAFAVPPGSTNADEVVYRADVREEDLAEERRTRRLVPRAQQTPWTPSIHMPRAFSRILLEVTDVRVERLQAITEDDVYAEGVTIPVTDVDGHGKRYPGGQVSVLQSITGKHPSYKYLPKDPTGADAVRAHFASLWDSINHERAPWSSDPWVWVVGFKRVEVR